MPVKRGKRTPRAGGGARQSDPPVWPTVAARVREALGGVPWSRARDLCRTGRVRVAGERVMDDALRVDPAATLEIDQNAPKELRGVLSPDDVVHVDDDVMVVRKAAGVLSVPYEDGDKDTLIDRARADRPASPWGTPRGTRPRTGGGRGSGATITLTSPSASTASHKAGVGSMGECTRSERSGSVTTVMRVPRCRPSI